jgi:hypothetical protein
MQHARLPDDYLSRLRQWRNRPEPDVSLGFLSKLFKQEIEKPFKQLAEVSQVWAELVPEAMARRSRLESLERGVLRVTVDSSATLYGLDRLLRSGLQRRLITACKGPAVRRVKLQVGHVVR